MAYRRLRNVHARPNAVGWDASAWVCGSHIDSVPNGGDYDGVAGCTAPSNICGRKEDRITSLPLELIVWAEEEGPTFGLGMLGSRAWAVQFRPSNLRIRCAMPSGKTYLEAVRGVRRGRGHRAADRFWRDRLLGLIEVHIEQGPAMWDGGEAVGVVTAIAGRLQYKAKFTGRLQPRGEHDRCGSVPTRFCRRGPGIIALRLSGSPGYLGPRTAWRPSAGSLRSRTP